MSKDKTNLSNKISKQNSRACVRINNNNTISKKDLLKDVKLSLKNDLKINKNQILSRTKGQSFNSKKSLKPKSMVRLSKVSK